jgi:hypothetical protein
MICVGILNHWSMSSLPFQAVVCQHHLCVHSAHLGCAILSLVHGNACRGFATLTSETAVVITAALVSAVLVQRSPILRQASVRRSWVCVFILVGPAERAFRLLRHLYQWSVDNRQVGT